MAHALFTNFWIFVAFFAELYATGRQKTLLLDLVEVIAFSTAVAAVNPRNTAILAQVLLAHRVLAGVELAIESIPLNALVTAVRPRQAAIFAKLHLHASSVLADLQHAVNFEARDALIASQNAQLRVRAVLAMLDAAD